MMEFQYYIVFIKNLYRQGIPPNLLVYYAVFHNFNIVVLVAVGRLTVGVGTASGIALLATSVLDDIVGVGLLTIGLVPVAAPGSTVGGELVGGPKTTFGVLL